MSLTDNNGGFVSPPEAPVFEPTEDEFRNPYAYLCKIRPVAEKYGICKIRPPSSWQPPFAADVDSFKFVPRVQRINELEAKTRTKLNFLDNLAKFWELQGVPLKIPTIEKKFLDLYTLRKLVEQDGGFEMMARDGRWSAVAMKMNFHQGKQVAGVLRQHYEKILYPYDVFLAKATDPSSEKIVKQEDGTAGVVMKMETSDEIVSTKPEDRSVVVADVTCTVKQDLSSDRVDCKGQGDGPVCANEVLELNEGKKKCHELKKLQFFGAGPKTALPDADLSIDPGFHESSDGKYSRLRRRDKKNKSRGLICRQCGTDRDSAFMLVCDECTDAYHNYCLVPTLHDIPVGVWHCLKCIARVCYKRTNKVYGFEQAGREYTLQAFGEMADKFKEEYFGAPVHEIPCSQVEKEFWRLVDSIEEDVVVEYGADNPVSEVGSGFPTESTHELFPNDSDYISSSWNLNNIACLKDSMLHFVSTNISGMTVPWCYVGMCFSCFAWHTEDHWTYSINYLHWGEPKTWYGVPSSNAEMLEEVMKRSAPELFEQSPDLLHQLTTIMNPNTLMTAGVPVFRTDQHAGDIIVTFPRGYHAGFNQGYNFAEAVNFCFADWLPMGRQCVEHYRLLKRQCVFSHDELVCKIASMPACSIGSTQAQMAYQDMLVMVEEEKKLRRCLLAKGIEHAEREAFELLPDDERQCEVCKTTCFLSAVTCECADGKLVCTSHADDLCNCPVSRRCLRYRHTLNELLSMLTRLRDSINQFEQWSVRVKAVCDSRTTSRKDISVVEGLLQEARERRFDDSALYRTLEKAATTVTDKCTGIVNRLKMNILGSKSESENACESSSLLSLPQMNNSRQDLNESDCVIKDEELIRELLSEVDKFQADVREALDEKNLDVGRLKELSDSELLTEFNLPELEMLKVGVQRAQWLNSARSRLASKNVEELRPEERSLDSLRNLTVKGLKYASYPSCSTALAELRVTLSACEEHEQKVNRCISDRPYETIAILEELVTSAKSLPAEFASTGKLQNVVQEAIEWNNRADAVLNNEQAPWFDTLADLESAANKIPVQLDLLPKVRSKLASAEAWLSNARKVFLGKKIENTLLEVLSPRIDTISASAASRHLMKHASSASSARELLVLLKANSGRELDEMLMLRRHKRSSEQLRITTRRTLAERVKCPCRQVRAETVVQCQLCLELLHARCTSFTKPVRVDGVTRDVDELSTAADSVTRLSYSDTSFICLHCRRSRRPTLEQVLALLLSLRDLGLELREGIALQTLTNRAVNWLERVRAALSAKELVAVSSIKQEVDRSSSLPLEQQQAENAVLSDEMLTTLDSLLVEGELLEIDLIETESIRSVLIRCQPETYSLHVFEPKSPQLVSDHVNHVIIKLKHSADGRRDTKRTVTTKPLTSRGDDDAVILIDDDEADDDERRGDVVVAVETCAAEKCRRPSGDGTSSLIQCDTCGRGFHLRCTGRDSSSTSQLEEYFCNSCSQGHRQKPSTGRPNGHQTPGKMAAGVGLNAKRSVLEDGSSGSGGGKLNGANGISDSVDDGFASDDDNDVIVLD